MPAEQQKENSRRKILEPQTYKARLGKQGLGPLTSVDLEWRFEEPGMEFLKRQDRELVLKIFKDLEGKNEEEQKKIIRNRVFENLLTRFSSLTYLPQEDFQKAVDIKSSQIEALIKGGSPDELISMEKEINDFKKESREIVLEATQLEIASGIASDASSEDILKNASLHLNTAMDNDYIDKFKIKYKLEGTNEEIRERAIRAYVLKKEKEIRDQDQKVHKPKKPFEETNLFEKTQVEKTQVLPREMLPGNKKPEKTVVEEGLNPVMEPTEELETQESTPLEESFPYLDDHILNLRATIRTNRDKMQELSSFYNNEESVGKYLEKGASEEDINFIKNRLEFYGRNVKLFEKSMHSINFHKSLYFSSQESLKEIERTGPSEFIETAREDVVRYREIVEKESEEIQEFIRKIVASSVDIFITKEKIQEEVDARGWKFLIKGAKKILRGVLNY